MTVSEAYAALGLDASSATPDEARSRFRDLIRSNHPDGKPSHEQAQATEVTRVIIEACTVLRLAGSFQRSTGKRSTDTGGAHRENNAARTAPAYDGSWLDGLWFDCLRSNAAWFVPPIFGVRFSFDAWTMGWDMIAGNQKRFK